MASNLVDISIIDPQEHKIIKVHSQGESLDKCAIRFTINVINNNLFDFNLKFLI